MQPFGGCLTRMAAFTHVPAQDELSSDVVGLDVYNKEKQNIGTIKDIALDASGLKGYVVGVGGLPQHALETIRHFGVVEKSSDANECFSLAGNGTALGEQRFSMRVFCIEFRALIAD